MFLLHILFYLLTEKSRIVQHVCICVRVYVCVCVQDFLERIIIFLYDKKN